MGCLDPRRPDQVLHPDDERVADLKTRLRTDIALTTPQARCKLYHELFRNSFMGDGYFDSAEFKSLGCGDWVPGDTDGD
jgi:hypothetical protein